MVAFVVFAYAIPVPLSHLFSEVRVRNIIIEKGWYSGLKSIFQTSEAIRKENIEYLKSRIGTSVRRVVQVKVTAECTNPGKIPCEYIHMDYITKQLDDFQKPLCQQ